MPSRKWHSKSRRGCTQCRARKRKCDEANPCKNCISRGLNCSLGESSLVIIPSRRSPHNIQHTLVEESGSHDASPFVTIQTDENLSCNPDNSGSSCNQAPASAHESAETFTLKGDAQDVLRLTHFYALFTCRAIAEYDGKESRALHVWKGIIPALAFDNDYLLHGLHAITALHLSLLRPSPENSNAALYHYTKALALFQPRLIDITISEVPALVVFSCMIPLYLFGANSTETSTYESIPQILEIITLLRGVGNIVQKDSHHIKSGPLASLMPIRVVDPSSPLPKDIECHLNSLFLRIIKIPEPATREAYLVALAGVRETLQLAGEHRNKTVCIVPFALSVPDIFIDGLRDHDPMALAILASYGAVLYWFRRFIWLSGWGRRMVTAVDNMLGEDWGDCMAWPKLQIEKKREYMS